MEMGTFVKIKYRLHKTKDIKHYVTIAPSDKIFFFGICHECHDKQPQHHFVVFGETK
jgi:hypothetical protein